MGKLSSNMDKLTNCISDGFSLLQGLIYPTPAAGTYYQPYAGYNPPQQSGTIFHHPVQTIVILKLLGANDVTTGAHNLPKF